MPLSKLPPVDIPEQVSLPQGTAERRNAAVARLAPFEGVWERPGETPERLSEQVAIDAVENIARYYNTCRYLESHAPRSAAVIKKIEKLKKCADNLARELSGLDVLAARIILGETHLCSGNRSYAAAFERADITGLLPNGEHPSAWSQRINAFSEALEILLTEIPKDWERRGYTVKDKGSKRNHFIEREGTAKHKFLTDALHLYDVFKPGQATGTEESDLHQFVNEIYEYATGKEPNEGLLRPLRDLIKPTREENEIDKRNEELLRELETMAPGKTIEFLSDEELKRMSELHAELSRNLKRRAELSKITWPHSPLPASPEG